MKLMEGVLFELTSVLAVISWRSALCCAHTVPRWPDTQYKPTPPWQDFCTRCLGFARDMRVIPFENSQFQTKMLQYIPLDSSRRQPLPEPWTGQAALQALQCKI